MIRLAIAEDHQSLIDGIKLLLEYEEDISIVGTANDGEELLKIVELKRPTVVLTDIRMPKLDGIEATKHIKKSIRILKLLHSPCLTRPTLSNKCLMLVLLVIFLKTPHLMRF